MQDFFHQQYGEIWDNYHIHTPEPVQKTFAPLGCSLLKVKFDSDYGLIIPGFRANHCWLLATAGRAVDSRSQWSGFVGFGFRGWGSLRYLFFRRGRYWASWGVVGVSANFISTCWTWSSTSVSFAASLAKSATATGSSATKSATSTGSLATEQ